MLAAGSLSSIRSQRFPWTEKYKQILILIENLHKTFSQSYQDVPQLLRIVEGDRVVLEQGF